MFRKPSVADIYVKQLQTRLDQQLVAVYPPDAPDIRVGTIGRFVEGRFDRRGHLAELLGGEDGFCEAVALTKPNEPTSFSFHSDGAVRLEPSAAVSVAGREMLKTKLAFTGDRAVVASFTGVRERAVQSPRAFDTLLWRLYLDGELAGDEVVIALHRHAEWGTVLVNRKGGVDLTVSADPSVVGPVLSLGGLAAGCAAAGIQFGEGSQVSSIVAGPNLTVALKAKGLNSGETARIADVRRFEAGAAERAKSFEEFAVPSISAADVVAQVDFDTPEE